MIIVSALMLLVPGLISIRILWHNRKIEREDYKFIICDYLVYSFLIQMVTYAFMFLTYPQRMVSFSLNIGATSHILSASFVFKYSFIALLSAMFLSAFVPWVVKIFTKLERGRKEQNKDKTS